MAAEERGRGHTAHGPAFDQSDETSIVRRRNAVRNEFGESGGLVNHAVARTGNIIFPMI